MFASIRNSLFKLCTLARVWWGCEVLKVEAVMVGATTFSTTILSITTLSMKDLFVTLSINDSQFKWHSTLMTLHTRLFITCQICWVLLCWVSRFMYCYAKCHYAECWYAERRYAECRSAFWWSLQTLATIWIPTDQRNYTIWLFATIRIFCFKCCSFLDWKWNVVE